MGVNAFYPVEFGAKPFRYPAAQLWGLMLRTTALRSPTVPAPVSDKNPVYVPLVSSANELSKPLPLMDSPRMYPPPADGPATYKQG